MLTYEQAYEAALRLMPNIDACAEYENAYMFKRKAENHSIGGHGFIIIMKDSGKTVPQTEFFEKYATELIREFDVTAEYRKSKKTRKRRFLLLEKQFAARFFCTKLHNCVILHKIDF